MPEATASELIDAHVHFDERLVPIDGMLASMDVAGISRAALIAPLTDDLDETPLVRRGAPILRRGLTSGVRILRHVTRRIYDRLGGNGRTMSFGGARYRVYAQPDNAPVAAAVRKHPARFFAWTFINPAGPVKPCDELERWTQPGMIGAKCHQYWHRYPLSALDDAAAWCEEKGLPMLIHLSGERDFCRLPTRFPKLDVVFAHAGVPHQRAVCDLARERKNVHVDLSSPGYVDTAIAQDAVRRATAAKCLFGSDGPYFHHAGDRVDFEPSRQVLSALRLSDAERRGIRGENFLRLIADPR